MSSLVSINQIVRESLMECHYPLHYYMRFLHLALNALEELGYDFPLNIKETRLTVTDYNAAIVPSDFVSLCRVSVEKDDKLEPLVQDDSLNGLYKYDSSGNKVPYTKDVENADFDFYYLYGAEHRHNSQGEYLGRHYGYVESKQYSYRYIPERSEIQFGVELKDTKVVLRYITTGVSTSAANMVHPYAKETIKAWIDYKRKKHLPRHVGTLGGVRDADDYLHRQRTILRARMHPISIEDILLAARRGDHAGLKN